MATVSDGAAQLEAQPKIQGRALAGVITAMLLTLLLAALDQTIVGTALPKIAGNLNGYSLISWVGTAYLLSSATLIPIIGKLSDQFGRKWFLIGSVIIFLLGSALCGAAQSMEQLIAFRAFQGLGAAGLLSLTFTLVGDIFTPAERPRWQGVFGIVFGVSSVIGPLLGGTLTDNFSWRWVFYVNLPIGIFSLAALLLLLPANISIRTTTGTHVLRRIDWSGAILSAAATVCLLLGLSFGSEGPAHNGYNWNSVQVLSLLIGAGVMYIAFFINEGLVSEPILPLKLFGGQVFAAAAFLSFVSGMAFLAIVYYLPTFIQGVLGQAATNSGVVITPLTFTLIAFSIAGGQIIARVGRYQWALILGSLILTLGVFLLSRMDASVHVLTVSLIMMVLGAGLGLIQPNITLAIQNTVQRNQLGVATAASTYLRSLGSTFGVAILGSVITSTFSTELNNNFPKLSPGVPSALVPVLHNQDVLENALTNGQGASGFSQSILTRAEQAAASQVPAGPNHAQGVATATAQVQQHLGPLLHTDIPSVFEAARLALGTSIIHAFGVTLIMCAFIFIGTLFLKDIPLQGARQGRRAGLADGAGEHAPTGLASFGE